MQPTLQFGDFTLDRSVRALRCREEAVPLTGRAFDLLCYMAAHPGRLLLKEELLKAVLPDSFVEESNLSQNVFVIRKALGAAGEGAIRTLPGRGYLFTPEVTEVVPSPHGPAMVRGLTFEATETRVVFQEDTEEHVRFWRSPVTLSFAAVAFLLLLTAGWLGWQRYEDRVSGPPVQVVVADLEGSTGDGVLDRTLTSILSMEMAQSPFVTVLSGNRMRSTMAMMRHQPDDPVTGQVARDLCERTGSQAVLRLGIARAGSRYVLLEEATSCVDGSSLATAKQDVARVDDLPQAILENGTSIRHTLGESRRMIARFNRPLMPATTGSLEALKDYSQAEYLRQRGRFPESLELLKHAVAIDPHFTAAFISLAVVSGNMGDSGGGRNYVQKAYDERENATEPVKLFATAYYTQEITGDLDESVRNYKAWINLYPRQVQPWAGLGEAYRLMGDYSRAVDADEHSLQMAPTQAIVYYGLANAQMRTGDYAAAAATCRLGIARNLDGENIRLTLLRLGHLQHDAGKIAEQEAWLRQHPDSPLMLVNQANFAQAEGRIKEAQTIFEQAWDVYRRQGAPDAATRYELANAYTWWQLNELEVARRYLNAAPIQAEVEDLLALAVLGDPEKAQTLLDGSLASHPHSTLWNKRYAPLLRGEFALLAHKPHDALTLMEPSRQLDGQGLDGYWLRGMAYMQANQLDQAEAEFRALLAHPFIEPAAAGLPLAHLELARILTRKGDKTGAAEAYRDFLASWSHADSGQPLLIQAENESRALQSPTVR